MTPESITIRIRRGLDLPIDGAPAPELVPGPAIREVGVIAEDYRGLRPRLLVEPGARVGLGQPLFRDRLRPDVCVTAPASGVVSSVERGQGRALLAIAIAVGEGDEVRFERAGSGALASWDRARVIASLLASGLWTALRTRPFGNVPDPATAPRAILVAAIETEPLAPPPAATLDECGDAFAHGLVALTRLTDGPVWVCCAPRAALPAELASRVRVARFDGPHPAGLPGTHAHFLQPVGRGRPIWYVRYPDVAAIGKLFATGRLWTERVISLAGPVVRTPRLLRTRLGASTEDLTRGQLLREDCRVVSGSVLSGRRAASWARYLGRFHTQVCALPEGDERRSRWTGWSVPRRGGRGVGRLPLGLGRIGAARRWTTSLHGEPGPMIPLGRFERVMPLELLATPLLRALAAGDLDAALELGALELEEEDLALCSFLCEGKLDYGELLRRALDALEREL